MGREVERAFAAQLAVANDALGPLGVKLESATGAEVGEELDPLLDAQCTLELPSGHKLEDYREPQVPPPCRPERNERARNAYADAHERELVVFFSGGQRPQWDPKQARWVMRAARSSHSGYFRSHVQMAPIGPSTPPWTLAHEIGHYFGLRHTHGPLPLDREDAARLVCAETREQAAEQVFDGDLGFVRDTPPDPGKKLYSAPGLGAPAPCSPAAAWASTPWSLTVDCGPGDTRAVRFAPAPLRTNLMSYWNQSCLAARPSLTEEQGRAVIRALTEQHRRRLVGRSAPPPTDPALALFADHVHVLLRASDGSIRHHWQPAGADDSFDAWLERANDFPAQTPGAPAVVTEGDRLHVFVLTESGKVAAKVWDGRRWHPSPRGWDLLDGRIHDSLVAVSANPGSVDLVGRDERGDLWHRHLESGAWAAWQRVDGPVAEQLGVASRAPGTLEVVARSAQGRLVHARWSQGVWSGFAPLGPLAISGPPVLVAPAPERLVALARSERGELLGARFEGGTWSKLSAVGSLPGPGELRAAPWRGRVAIVTLGAGGAALIAELPASPGDATPLTWRDLGARLRRTPALLALGEQLLLYGVDDKGELWSHAVASAGPEARWAWLGRW